MSKYGLAKRVIRDLDGQAKMMAIESMDAQEALLISLVQTLKEGRGADHIRGILRYELDSLGSSGMYEIQRGGGHS